MIIGEEHMDTYNNRSSSNADMRLYRALAAGDLPAAQLIISAVKKSSGSAPDAENPATSFNRGLCLFLLEEYEGALSELKRAEQQAGNPPEIDIADKQLFIKALELSSRGQKPYLLPLDPECGGTRYVLIRVKWLTALCLKALGREGEAAMIKRFLSRYNIDF